MLETYLLDMFFLKLMENHEFFLNQMENSKLTDTQKTNERTRKELVRNIILGKKVNKSVKIVNDPHCTCIACLALKNSLDTPNKP